MKTLATPLGDMDAIAPAAGARPAAAPLGALLREALARAGQMARGTDTETARAVYLAQAASPADLERRSDAWERAQAAYRTLPPTF